MPGPLEHTPPPATAEDVPRRRQHRPGYKLRAGEDIGVALGPVDSDGDVGFCDEDEALPVDLRDARWSDLVKAREEPSSQEEAGDVAGPTGDVGAVGDEVIADYREVPQAQTWPVTSLATSLLSSHPDGRP